MVCELLGRDIHQRPDLQTAAITLIGGKHYDPWPISGWYLAFGNDRSGHGQNSGLRNNESAAAGITPDAPCRSIIAWGTALVMMGVAGLLVWLGTGSPLEWMPRRGRPDIVTQLWITFLYFFFGISRVKDSDS